MDKDAQPALESSAGYNQFLIGAPHYLLLMSAPHSYAAINAGYMMEDLVLKLTELDIDTCWMTFTDSDKIKQALSPRHSVRGGGNRCLWLRGKDRKKLRLNILSMSQIDVRAEQQYYAPKKGVHDLVHMGSWSNKSGLDEMMDFYDDMLWQSIYAASLSPAISTVSPMASLCRITASIWCSRRMPTPIIWMPHWISVLSCSTSPPSPPSGRGRYAGNFHLLRPTACRKDFAPLRCTTCNDSGEARQR